MSATAQMRFALYARVSTEAQEEDGQSLDTQLRMMSDAVRGVGGVVSREYRVQESAMPGRERPSLALMLKDAASGQFDAVMVCKLDRLARSIDVSSHVESSLRDFGIELFEGGDRHNLRSAEGRLTRGMQALIGEYSVNRLKWSACASRLERAKRGWPHSGMLPWGRCIEKVKDRRNQSAVWSLDSEKAELAQKMFSAYVGGGTTLADVGRKFGMNPETMRRVMMEQGGSTWTRHFVDPATGQMVEVKTSIPPLFSDEQLLQLSARAQQNQVERANWAGRMRDYPLSPYIRCMNPRCGWSNLSGHQTTGSSNPTKQREGGRPSWAYYRHLPRSRIDDDCLHAIPADAIEDEVFSRLGQLLKSSDALEAAIRAALKSNPEQDDRLRNELADLGQQEKTARRILNNALEVVFEHKGTAAAQPAEAKVQAQNDLLASIDARRHEIEDALRVIEIPKDFPARFAAMMHKLTGMNGHIPMHWPMPAKRDLLAIFFAGAKSTRFDRSAKGVRSDTRGIFVEKLRAADGETYWHYEVRGALGDFSGALTSIVELYEANSRESIRREFNIEELQKLAALTPTFSGLKDFRSSWDVSRRWSGSACR